MLLELREAAKGQVIWDQGDKSSVKGLHVRVTPAGQKMFYVYYRTKWGQQRRPKIGEFGVITLIEARRRAKKLIDKVEDGEDPKGLWEEKRVEATVQELFDRCFKEHWDTPRFRASGYAREVTNQFAKNIKNVFGHLRLSEVTVGRVREWHKSYIEKPYTGNRALTVLCKLFSYAEEIELRPQHTNPCRLVKTHSEEKRERFATAEEIQAIFPLLSKYEKLHPAGVAYLYLLMFSGSRPRAIERATWDQIKEFQVGGETFGTLTFGGKSTGKTGLKEKVVLPPLAMSVLLKLPRVEGGTITGIKMPRRLWLKIRDEAKCPDLWARDWRRTFASAALSNGATGSIIGELLNHHSADTTKVYTRLLNTSAFAVAKSTADMIEKMGAPKDLPVNADTTA